MTIDQLRKELSDMERLNVRTSETIQNIPQAKQSEEVNDLQIKLNIRDADMARMNNLLQEMHRRMDDIKQEASDAKIEATEADRAQSTAIQQIERVVAESQSQVKVFNNQISDLERQL